MYRATRDGRLLYSIHLISLPGFRSLFASKCSAAPRANCAAMDSVYIYHSALVELYLDNCVTTMCSYLWPASPKGPRVCDVVTARAPRFPKRWLGAGLYLGVGVDATGKHTSCSPEPPTYKVASARGTASSSEHYLELYFEV